MEKHNQCVTVNTCRRQVCEFSNCEKTMVLLALHNIWSLNYSTTVTNTNELEVSELVVCRILFYYYHHYYLEDVATDKGLFSKIRTCFATTWQGGCGRGRLWLIQLLIHFIYLFVILSFFCMKIVISSQWREDQQHGRRGVTCKPALQLTLFFL